MSDLTPAEQVAAVCCSFEEYGRTWPGAPLSRLTSTLVRVLS